MNKPVDSRLLTLSRFSAAGEAIFPQTFSESDPAPGVQSYLADPLVRKMLEFFQRKGLAALKEEDRREQWYDDWIAYQAEHRLYAGLISPKEFSSFGTELNLLKLTRFIEVFAYCSPSHGYSLQVSFLGLFSILMGTNTALKQEAVKALEEGGLFAFGVSEKAHGSDLLGNEFTIEQTAAGRFVANGSKYYIGNANAASIISILARKKDRRTADHLNRAPFAFFALRPGATGRGTPRPVLTQPSEGHRFGAEQSNGFQNLRKIHTLGVRAAFVGEFSVKDHELPESDIIAQGRKAWDAVFGTVTLGNFFLGFGAIGICEHALNEAASHLAGRMLFGAPAIDMPHLRSMMAEAYARLTAMKLYAYRALDYVQIGTATDRRYMLFTAVQKAKVSTEGVKVMALLSECIGAKGFEADTYFEMALRDAQLVPGLEGSTHINLGFAGQFIANYFANFDPAATVPPSLFAGRAVATENPYLMQATTHGINKVRFPRFLQAYRKLIFIPNVRLFVKQVAAFRSFTRRARARGVLLTDAETSLALDACFATIVYAQLVAENAVCLNVPPPVISMIFHILVRDLSAAARIIATMPTLDDRERMAIRRMVLEPAPRGADWSFVAECMARTSERPQRD